MKKKLYELQKEPLTQQIKLGKLPKLDAIAIDYFLSPVFREDKLPKEKAAKIWTNNKPYLYDICQTCWGQVGLLVLPVFETDLYEKENKLIKYIIEAIDIAHGFGVRNISLTGLIPSATDYGKKVVEELKKQGKFGLLKLSTGHETTCASIILNIKRILQESGRKIQKEKIAFIGLGSIGLAVLRLLLSSQKHPKKIILCDLPNKKNLLEAIKKEIVKKYKFKGTVEISSSSIDIGDEVYKKATMFIGATNVPDVVDANKLRPGSLIVDDSWPHCFSFKKAKARFENKKDILFTEGGTMMTPKPVRDLLYIPKKVKPFVSEKKLESVFIKSHQNEIVSCVASGLFGKIFKLGPTIGFVKNKVALDYLKNMEKLKIKGALLHLHNYVLPEKDIISFKKKYSKLK